MTVIKWGVGAFTVTSYGNGTSYLLQDPTDGREAFLQGDDASQWREEYDKAEDGAAFIRDTIDDHNQG